MREILFRGKRINNGEWVEGFFAEKKDSLLESDVRNAFILDQARGDFFATLFPVDPSTVGQYTGLMEWLLFADTEIAGNIHDNQELLEGGASE